jgi:hypothetical protein
LKGSRVVGELNIAIADQRDAVVACGEVGIGEGAKECQEIGEAASATDIP